VRVDILTKEYPPNIYGGAGVHVAELVKALRSSGIDTQVRAFGEPIDEPGTQGFPDLPELADANGALKTLGVDLTMVPAVAGADVVHSHTWYANFAGHLSSMLHGIPHVVSAHSLEPMRPWKAEQLGGGYAISSFIERTAYEGAAAVIAVSEGMRKDVLASYPQLDPAKVHVVHNGIDAQAWAPDRSDAAFEIARRHGVDPERPSIVFVGRITRQKGVPFLLRAMRQVPANVQLVFCAGAPDTPEILAEVEGLIDQLRAERDGVVWIPDMLPREEVVALLSQATTFVCPSVYEPLGIVNLEAMACEAAVVATATGGIPEVVVDGETGVLVDYDAEDAEGFERGLAEAVNAVAEDPDRARALGEAGLARAREEFSWRTIAQQTVDIYKGLI